MMDEAMKALDDILDKYKELQAENAKLKEERNALRRALHNIIAHYKIHCSLINANWGTVADEMKNIASAAYYSERD